MSFLAPLFFVGLAALAVPVLVHLIQRERKDVVEFPSLMFIRRIPYQSVERRKIHNWLLLAFRLAAMTLVVIAFARPFLTQDPIKAAAALTGAREVVILLDRSASMGYGDHFERAKTEAKKVIDSLSGEDQATLVLFGTSAEETIRATSDRGRLTAAVDAAKVSSDGTRYAPALRLAQSLLGRSALPRKEALLISDFQRTGWERQEEIHLPEGATLTPVSVASLDTSDLAIASAAFQRSSFSGEERVMVTASLINRGGTPMPNIPVRLEIDGRLVDTRQLSLGPNESGAVTFPQFTVSQSSMRGTIRAGTDAMPADNLFDFALSPSRPVSVLVINGEGNGPQSTLFLSTALSIGTTPPFKVDVLPVSKVVPGSFEKRSIVVLNDATALNSQTNDLLKRFVEQGGGLLVALGDHNPWNGESELLPGKLGSAVDRTGVRGGTLGFLDYSHPIFDQFKDPRNGNFTGVRFYKYRTLTPAQTDHVLARFDDGGVALVERKVGSGRVLAWTTSLDDSWNDFPKRSMFLPLVHEVARYLARYQEPETWYTVGRMLDISVPLDAMVREGALAAGAGPRTASGVVVSPSGEQRALGGTGTPSVELAEQGFYSVRLQGTSERRPFAVAVNLDPAESDLTPMPAAEFVGTATGRAAVTATGQSLEHPDLTPEDVEKKQSYWWYLFVAGVVALFVEAVLSNRLSRRGTGGLAPAGQ